MTGGGDSHPRNSASDSGLEDRLLVLSNPNHWTLPLGAANYSTEHSADTAGVLAFTTLSMIPALTFFLFAERRIVGGLSGAVKG
jgi:raffinose/stachyose/melibiose transport system permease protein